MERSSWLRRYLGAAASAAVLALVAATPAGASGVTTTDLDNGVTATQLAQALAGSGVAISNVTYTGADRAAGSFTGGTGNVGIGTGIVLSSGNVQTYGGATPDDPCSRGVEGPNNCSEHADAVDGGANDTTMGTAGDADLDALITDLSEDAAVLEFDFVPQQGTVQFRYVFSSEEYNDWVNSSFNDVFGFFVNGTNCAVVPGTTTPVSVNTINNGDDGGGPATNPTLYRDNVRPNPSIDTQMDGLTVVLTCRANVTAGATNTMKLAIADVSDSALDSAVFLEAGSLVSGEVLTVSKNGTGSGTVTSSPAGIDCGATCVHSYADDTVVTLTPAASGGSQFTGWSGACTGTGTCQVTMSEARSVTATFDLLPGNLLTVTKAGTGTGSVTSSPAGINCGTTCSFPFDGGTVTLTATPDAHSTFTGWSGACSGTGTCEVTMDQARSVTATFAADSHTLTVVKAGGGSGTVTSAPAGVDCGSDCEQTYQHGTVVTLTASPAADSVFTGWTGACSGTGTCLVTMSEARSVTATFAIATRTLNVGKAGNGSGGVTSSPAGIDCGSDCTNGYAHGTVVTLTATPAGHSTFTGWSGACSGTGTCQVTMDQARTVTATFALDSHQLTVGKAGTGSGTVTGSPAGIDCGSDCGEAYVHGTVVTLTAAAASGSTFTGWTGDCTGTGSCVVTLDQARNVTATFTANTPPDGDVDGPPDVGAGDLFCGVQHRGKCKGLKVKGIFDRPGNAVWTFAAYNPTPGKSGAGAAAKKKLRLGQVKRTIAGPGTVEVTFKLKKGAKTRKLYRIVRKRKFRSIRVTLTFTSGTETSVQRATVKLKR